MVLDSTGVLAVEQAPLNGCRQCVCPQGELHLPPASLPRPAGRSDPDSFEVTAFALDPRECEVLSASFKSGVSILHSPLPLPKVSPTGFPRQIFLGACFPGAGPLGWGPQCGAWTPLLLGEKPL